jgi:hypothetical protein
MVFAAWWRRATEILVVDVIERVLAHVLSETVVGRAVREVILIRVSTAVATELVFFFRKSRYEHFQSLALR